MHFIINMLDLFNYLGMFIAVYLIKKLVHSEIE